MSNDCISVVDAIWNHHRDGTAMMEKDLRHIQHCHFCNAALAEAQSAVPALKCLEAKPTAPDCRAAVMAQIAGTRRRAVSFWAYAPVPAVAVAACLAVALHVTLHPTRKPVRMARHVASKTASRPAVADAGAVANQAKPLLAHPISAEQAHSPKHKGLSGRKRQLPVVATSHRPRRSAKPSATSGESFATATATWSVDKQPENTYQYSYALKDPTTGEVTNCAVRRTGDNVEINMESEPTKPAGNSRLENKDHETHRSV